MGRVAGTCGGTPLKVLPEHPIFNSVLYQLIEVLYDGYKEFKSVHEEMAVYKNDIEPFRRSTSLKLFCAVQPKLSLKDGLPSGFKELVVEFNWPESVTLEDVETFRQRYAWGYTFDKCAMIINSIRHGSYKVTWFVPISIIDTLTQRKIDLLVEFNVTKLTLDGNCIYESQQIHSLGTPRFLDHTHPRCTPTTGFSPAMAISHSSYPTSHQPVIIFLK